MLNDWSDRADSDAAKPPRRSYLLAVLVAAVLLAAIAAIGIVGSR